VGKTKKDTELDEKYWKLVKRVSSNIRRIREQKGRTQEEMASLGFERRWFQRIESGTYSISLPTLDRLARVLKTDVIEFFR